MTDNKLPANIIYRVCKCKSALFLLNSCVEYHLEQNIAQLLPEKLAVLKVDSLADLICFLEKILSYGLMILLPVPWAAVFGTEDLHYPKQIVYVISVLEFKIHF